jgi:hypothetical protein
MNLDATRARHSADTRPMPTLLARRLLLASTLLATGVARAQLGTVSPFAPPKDSRGAAAPTADAPLEFRGVAEMPDGPAFRIVDPARKSGVWVRLNQRDSDLGLVVKQHDPARDTVTVEQNGRSFTLALRQSKVASSGAPATNAVMVPPQMPQVPTIAAMVQQSAPATPLQQSQIDAVAAAVAQRRALREQATQQVNQGLPITLPQLQQQLQQPQRGPKAGAANQNGQNAQGGRNGQNGQNAQRQRKGQP